MLEMPEHTSLEISASKQAVLLNMMLSTDGSSSDNDGGDAA